MNNLAEPAKGSKPLIKSMKKVGPLPLSQASGFRSLENRRVNRPRVIRTPASSRRSRRAARASLSFSPSPRSSSSSTLPTTPSTSTRKSPWTSRFSRLSLTLSSSLTTSPSRPASRPSSFGKCPSSALRSGRKPFSGTPARLPSTREGHMRARGGPGSATACARIRRVSNCFFLL